jgi:hypothetical protein
VISSSCQPSPSPSHRGRGIPKPSPLARGGKETRNRNQDSESKVSAYGTPVWGCRCHRQSPTLRRSPRSQCNDKPAHSVTQEFPTPPLLTGLRAILCDNEKKIVKKVIEVQRVYQGSFGTRKGLSQEALAVPLNSELNADGRGQKRARIIP